MPPPDIRLVRARQQEFTASLTAPPIHGISLQQLKDIGEAMRGAPFAMQRPSLRRHQKATRWNAPGAGALSFCVRTRPLRNHERCD